MKKISVIDLGSNSAKLTIAQLEQDGYSVLKNLTTYIRLSEGLTDSSNTLKPEPVMRTIAAIKDFVDVSEKFGVDKVYVLATEAVRRADNREWFAEVIKQFTGCELLVLPGDYEALYDCISASSETGFSDFVLIDTGGGSSEIALYKNNKVQKFVSMPWGAVTLTSAFSKRGFIGVDEVQKVTRYIADGLSSIEWLSECTNLPVIGVGGCLRVYDKLNPELTLSEFLSKILPMTPDERIEYGVSKDRADIITAGLLPANLLLLSLGVCDIRIANANIRDGFIRACVLNQ